MMKLPECCIDPDPRRVDDAEFSALLRLQRMLDVELNKVKAEMAVESALRARDNIAEAFVIDEFSPRGVMDFDARSLNYDSPWVTKFKDGLDIFLGSAGLGVVGELAVDSGTGKTQIVLGVKMYSNVPFEKQAGLLEYARYIKQPVGSTARCAFVCVGARPVTGVLVINMDWPGNKTYALLHKQGESQAVLSTSDSLEFILKYVYTHYPFVQELREVPIG